MNKESIYKIIGYHGKYSENVKKNLKKLLKENHPDHGGDKSIFKLLLDVKKELETKQVPFEYTKENNVKEYKDIDYKYCNEMIIKLAKEKEKIDKRIIEKSKEGYEVANNYRIFYRNSINEASEILNYNNKNTIKRIKFLSIAMLIILLITFFLAVLKNNLVMFGLFGILCFITILIIYKYFLLVRNISLQNEKRLNKYINVIAKMKNVSEKQDNLLKEIKELERKKENIENDLRFYNNLLK